MSQDIWDDFEKIAIAQGLISEAEKEDEKPKSRTGLADDAMRFLYGIEPDGIFKDKDIIEVAHPDTVVILPSYDAMNGILENENQRHDIMTYIALTSPNGKTTKRYVVAKENLMSSLVKAGFLLDNKNETELMILADECAVGLKKKSDEINNSFVKEANPIALGTVGIAAGAVLLIGGIYYFAYGAPTAQSVYINSKRVLEALQKLSNKPYANGIRTDVAKLLQMSDEAYANKSQLASVRSIGDVVDIAKKQQEESKKAECLEKLGNYRSQLNKILIAIPEWVSAIKSDPSKLKDQSSDIWAKIKGLADPFYNTDEEDLVEELYGKGNWFGSGRSGGLYEAITNEIAFMKSSDEKAQEHEPEVQKSVEMSKEVPFLSDKYKSPEEKKQEQSKSKPEQYYNPNPEGFEDLELGNAYQL
jgi:hypothetical protein